MNSLKTNKQVQQTDNNCHSLQDQSDIDIKLRISQVNNCLDSQNSSIITQEPNEQCQEMQNTIKDQELSYSNDKENMFCDVIKQDDKQVEKNKDEASLNMVNLLRNHLKDKYKEFSDQKIDDIIQNFIKNQFEEINPPDLHNDDNQVNDFEDQESMQSRSSLNTLIDWNDKADLQQYCLKQKKIEQSRGFRPSQYFGAVNVEKLEDGVDNPRIDELFQDCFGIETNRDKFEKYYKRDVKTQQQQYVGQQSQEKKENCQEKEFNGTQNDSQCKIVVNFYNQFQIVGQDQESKTPINENKSEVLKDVSNKNKQWNSNSSNCQVLHQEQKPQKNKVVNYSKESLKQFMSPSHQSKKYNNSIIEQSNQMMYKTHDQRTTQQDHIQEIETNSPNTYHPMNQTYKQSMPKKTQKVHSLKQNQTHHQSLVSLSQVQHKFKQNLDSVRQNSNRSQNHKSMLYKNQNQNMNSVTNQSSIESKPKQMNKLSYLSQKQLPEYAKNQVQLYAPKPPQQSQYQKPNVIVEEVASKNQNVSIENTPQNNLKSQKLFHKPNSSMQQLYQNSLKFTRIQHSNQVLYKQSVIESSDGEDKNLSSARNDSLSNLKFKQEKQKGRNQQQQLFKTMTGVNNPSSFLQQSTQQTNSQSRQLIQSVTEVNSPKNTFNKQPMQSARQKPQSKDKKQENQQSSCMGHYITNASDLNKKQLTKKPPSLKSGMLAQHNSSKNLKQVSQACKTLMSTKNQLNDKENQSQGMKSARNTSKMKYCSVTQSSKERQNSKTNRQASQAKSNERKQNRFKSFKQGSFKSNIASPEKSLNSKSSRSNSRANNQSKNHLLNKFISKTNFSTKNNNKQQPINKSLEKLQKAFQSCKHTQNLSSQNRFTSQPNKNMVKAEEFIDSVNSYQAFINQGNNTCKNNQNPKYKQQRVESGLRKNRSKANIENKQSNQTFRRYLSNPNLLE